MTHPSNAEAWKHFAEWIYLLQWSSKMYTLVHVPMTDGFSACSNAVRPYSVRPIVVCVYNLPPHMCMIGPYMFLSCVTPNPHNPKNKIDVYLQSLINELMTLWNERVYTYNVHTNETFKMKSTFMWTINDFLTCGMVSKWSTHDALSCLVFQDQTHGSCLHYGRTMSHFSYYHCFLSRHYSFKWNRNSFMKGRTVHGQPP